MRKPLVSRSVEDAAHCVPTLVRPAALASIVKVKGWPEGPVNGIHECLASVRPTESETCEAA